MDLTAINDMVDSAPAAADGPLLEGCGLACIRDDRLLFERLDFRLHPGQTLLIEGTNGSGKTSLLHILCGIRQPDEGEVRWNGENIERLGADYHEAMSYLGHRDGIKLDLSPRENLEMARALGAANPDISADEALDRVNLYGFEDVPARTLSAGQKRRVALARLFMIRARLWVMDEPLTSLDRAGIAMVEDMVKAHIEQGGMAVMTSHHDMHLDEERLCRIDLSS